MKLPRRHPQPEPGRRRPNPDGQRQAFSYYASRRSPSLQATKPAANQPRHAPEPRWTRATWRRLSTQFGKLAIVIIVVASLLSLLQVDNQPRIVLLNAGHNVTLHSVADYRAAASISLHGLANTNKITIDTAAINQQLQTTFPEVKDASVVLPLIGHRPVIYIQLTRPSLILTSGTQSMVVDDAGRALAPLSQAPSVASLHLPVVQDKSALPLKTGQVVLPSSAVVFIQTVLHQLGAQHQQVSRLVLPAGAEELDVYPAGQSYYGKFNLHETNVRQQVGTFLAVQQDLAGQHRSPHHYIDVRVAGRAYYK